MRPEKYSSYGIVIGRVSHGEADRVLTVYSKRYGKIRLLAKGIKRPKSRKRGHVEIFSEFKFSAVKTRGIDVVTEAQIVDSHQGVREDLKKVALAYYFAEVTNKLTRPEEENDKLYSILSYFMKQLDDEFKLKTLRYEFVRRVLVCLGFWPEGKSLEEPDQILEDISERKMSTRRVGLSMIQ